MLKAPAAEARSRSAPPVSPASRTSAVSSEVREASRGQDSSAAALDKQLGRLPKIAKGDIVTGDVVGKGRFKRAYKGRHKGKEVVLLRFAKDASRGFSPSPSSRGGGTESAAAEERDRNLNELRILALTARDAGPSVPEIYGACFEPHSTTIVQELATWGTLKDTLLNAEYAKRITAGHKLYASVQLARAMSFLESAHVVHADLSCRNILLFRLDSEPSRIVIKVSDFGLSVVLQDGTTSVVKKQPQATRWCAPETVLRMVISYRADAWSVGCTLWEMYAGGVNPWTRRQTRAEVASRLKDLAETGGLSEGGADVSEDFPIGEDCPVPLHTHILACLSVDEFSRPICGDLAVELLALAEPASSRGLDDNKELARVEERAVACREPEEELETAVQSQPGPAGRKFRLSMCSPGDIVIPEDEAPPPLEKMPSLMEVLKSFAPNHQKILLDAEKLITEQKEDERPPTSSLGGAERLFAGDESRGRAGPRGHYGVPWGCAGPLLRGPHSGSASGVSLSPYCQNRYVVSPRPGGDQAFRGLSPHLAPSASEPAATWRPASQSPRHLQATLPAPIGMWTLWSTSSSGPRRQDYPTEAESRQAFDAQRQKGMPCMLRDPAGTEVAAYSWTTSFQSRQPIPRTPRSARRYGTPEACQQPLMLRHSVTPVPPCQKRGRSTPRSVPPWVSSPRGFRATSACGSVGCFASASPSSVPLSMLASMATKSATHLSAPSYTGVSRSGNFAVGGRAVSPAITSGKASNSASAPALTGLVIPKSPRPLLVRPGSPGASQGHVAPTFAAAAAAFFANGID